MNKKPLKTAVIFTAGPSLKRSFMDCNGDVHIAVNSALDHVPGKEIHYLSAGDGSTIMRLKGRPTRGFIAMNHEQIELSRVDDHMLALPGFSWKDLGIEGGDKDGNPPIEFSLTAAIYFAANILEVDEIAICGWDCKPGPDCSGAATPSRMSEARWAKEREEVLKARLAVANTTIINFV